MPSSKANAKKRKLAQIEERKRKDAKRAAAYAKLKANQLPIDASRALVSSRTLSRKSHGKIGKPGSRRRRSEEQEVDSDDETEGPTRDRDSSHAGKGRATTPTRAEGCGVASREPVASAGSASLNRTSVAPHDDAVYATVPCSSRHPPARLFP